MIKPTQKRSLGEDRRKPASKKVTAEQRYCLIQEAAYLRAEGDNFCEDPCKYWVAAEAEVDARIAGGK